MKSKPDTFRSLIDAFGGVAAFATATGIGEHAAKKMRDRNSIAVDHWPAVIRAAGALGIAISSDDLVRMKVGEAA